MDNEITGMKVMIVEDDNVLRRAICRALKKWTKELIDVGSYAEAKKRLAENIDLVILDVNLPDGNGVDLAKEITELRPMPVMIAMSGEASAEQAFKLKELGVIGYLPKPISLNDLKNKIDELLNMPVNLDPHISGLVGKAPVKKVSNQIRRIMAEQALSLAQGNKSKAAEMLNISRQAVQQIISDLDINLEKFI